jgi:hypothetical protein
MAALLLASTQSPALLASDVAGTGGGLKSGSLFDALARMDHALFDASFVSCDASRANAIFDDDVEFYHDKDGFTAGEQVRESTRRLSASCPGKQGVTRSVVPGSLEVFPIEGYGAAQIGVHRFDEKGAATSTLARFVHVWRLEGKTWRLARILSLDHQTVSSLSTATTENRLGSSD